MTSHSSGKGDINAADDLADPFARQLKSRYLGRRRADLDVLAKALAADDFDTIRIAGHNMYGSGAAYGFEQVTTIGKGLEEAATARQKVAIEALIVELEKFIARQHFA
jgi:HPt (histidine-containing phosphotransfer) domain-containing protein